MSLEKRAHECLSDLNNDIIMPIARLRKYIDKMLSSRKMTITSERFSQQPSRFRFSQHFVPVDIQDAIRRDVNNVDRLSFDYRGTRYTIELYSHMRDLGRHSSSSLVNRKSRMVDAMAITVGMSRWCSCGLGDANVVIKLYDIDAPKMFSMDGQPITPSQVNSAYTIPCRYADDNGSGKYLEVVIFRKEEWTKVLFHELMHLYSYDISSNDRRINARLSRVFHVDCDFNVTEAYAEFWARILWTMWSSGGRGNRFSEEIDRQRQWSIRQGVMVTINSDLANEINDDRSRIPKCKETTASFSYYVICGLMMTEWEKVVVWCCETNKFPIVFRGGYASVNSLIGLLKEIDSNSIVIEEWAKQRDSLLKNKRMSLSSRMTRERIKS